MSHVSLSPPDPHDNPDFDYTDESGFTHDIPNSRFNRDVWKDGCYGNPDILMRQLWPCWQARAALSAPSHGEQVRDFLPGLELAHDLLWPAGVPVNFIRIIERAMRDARTTAPSAGSQEQGDDAERAALECTCPKMHSVGKPGLCPIHDASYIKSQQASPAMAQSERVPAWIAVSERLPEPCTDVLAYGVNHRSHSYVVAGVFSGTWASQETEEATRFEPTHWMPLPAAPSANSQKEQGE